MSSNIINWLLVIAILCVVQLNCEIYQDRPKIKTSDGDLILQPALDKHIYLQPNGPQSRVFIGNVDILKTNSPKDEAQYQEIIKEEIGKYLNGPNGILQRLQKCEDKAAATSDPASLNMTTLWSNIGTYINNRLLAFQNQVSNRPENKCNSNPCQHGGTCLNLVDDYHCLCPSNWEGKHCDVDFNECRNFAGTDLGCQNGAVCINKPGTYECLCKPNWFGVHCTTKAKDCSSGDYEMCGHGTCIPVPTGEGIKCICHQGWTTNATNIECLTDVNECESHQGAHCSVNPKVECINVPGSFRCGQCPAGYEGDGYICSDIDECITIRNGGCSPLVTCHNIIGSRRCGSCPPGYQGDGVTCAFIGSCSVNNGRCHPSAQCNELQSPAGITMQCVCPEGMDGDGVGLSGCHGSMNSNYTGVCEGNPCGSQGRCYRVRSGYICICNKGYNGAHCESPGDSCVFKPCQNGGTCQSDSLSGFHCKCTEQYSGSFCEVRSKPCGGMFDAAEGIIDFPLSNTTFYNDDVQCEWVLLTDADKVFNVTFNKFHVKATPECMSDFLLVHDGRRSSAQVVGRFCGNKLPKGGNFVSNHNYLYLWLHSETALTKSTFTLHWTSIMPVCGGVVNASVPGYINSPGSPGPYPPNRDCYWHVRAVPGKRISLHFFSLDIGTQANSSFDFLKIYDGEHTKDPLLGRYVNFTQPQPVQSKSCNILIHFHSDASGTGNGFQIAYIPVEGIPLCGGHFTANSGEIVAPTRRELYLNNLLCEYKIETSADMKVRLHFAMFKLENSFNCIYDYLKIYDGPSTDAPLVGKFCGSEHLDTYTSSSNNLYLKFETDGVSAAAGFRIIYEAVCEEKLLGDSGVIKTPLYPFNYPRNKLCMYTIVAEPGKAIQLTFQDFDIQAPLWQSRCLYDSVQVRDGQSTLLGTYCGGLTRIPPIITSTHNYMYVRFQSDSSVSGRGFYANYTTVDIQCGGIYENITGFITYPAEDNGLYQNGQTCQWLIIAPQGRRIQLTWSRFIVKNSTGCADDYLKLTETNLNEHDEVIGKYCGCRTPPALTTSSNQIKLKFVSEKSDTGIGYPGFSLSYTFIDDRFNCGGNYVTSHGYIRSPGWPERYGPLRRCTWTVTVPVGQQVALNFTFFDLEPPLLQCINSDYLEIRNGGSDVSPLIGRYCDEIKSKQIISFANVIYLYFQSDYSYSGKGFNIEWSSTVTGCGGTLTSSTGSIASPNYPNNYHENAECFYKIAINAGSRIRISFTLLDLQSTPDCRDDYIAMYDGRDTNAPSLGKHCIMTTKLTNIETTTNYAVIKFRSDFSVKEGKGFSLNYVSICNNNVTGRYGTIESPNFPNTYQFHLDCLWNIRVPKGNRINVTFTHFEVYKNTDYDCQEYLQIKEHFESDFQKKICGESLPDPLTSKTNSVDIKFHTSGFGKARTGFRLEWVSYGCGGHVNKLSGTIAFDRSLTTEKEMECEWLIETTPGDSISINFTDIYMLQSDNCTTDAIEIYNGQNADTPLLSKTCHRQNTAIQTDSNYMFIRFVKLSTLRDVHFVSRYHSSKSKCGGSMKAISGYVYSKNYPKNYYNNENCIWYITVPENHRIEIDLIDLDLYSATFRETNDDGDCGDSIMIYDDDNYSPSSNYTYRICPNSNKTQFITKHHHAVVQFKSDAEGTAKGFKISFKATCGAVINAKQDGIITNNKYIADSNVTCTWTIIATSLIQKISLTFTHMSLPKDTDVITNRHCPSAFLRVLDGNDDDAPLIGEYCGRKVPPMIASLGNAITIELGSYTDSMLGQFSVHYTPVINACGGTLTAVEGSIASPFYPRPYPVDTDCEWVIKTSPGNTAYITFEQFDLEYSEGCNEDYLELRENNGVGKLLGVYCGSDVPTNHTRAANIYIKFHSSSSVSRQGFLLHYEYLHDNLIRGDYGEIASPLYPAAYTGAAEYSWRIIASGHKSITLTVDNLDIPSQADMSYNKLTIFDGYDNTASILGQLHGALSEKQFYRTSSSVLYILLTMDQSNTGSMFHITWTKSSNMRYIHLPSQYNCGSNRTEMIVPGQIIYVKPPNYPNVKRGDLNCEWIFRTEIGRHVSLSFLKFKMTVSNECYLDAVSIYSADMPGNWHQVKKICSPSTASDETNSTYMKINFKKRSYMSCLGFLAVLTSQCGGTLIELSGEFGPTWHDGNKTSTQTLVRCDWRVKVRPGRTIKLKFIHFNITNNNSECATSVVLRNGDSMEAPLLGSGRYCGHELENKADIETSSNALFVSYKSETSDHRPNSGFQSFKIYYEEKSSECGLTSTLTQDHGWGTISSPNYPSVPLAYSECVWSFSGPRGEVLRIDFIDRFDVDRAENCGSEAVEIHDGLSSLSPLIGRYCGDKPATIKTTSNTVYIKYSTQLAEPRNGFKANISIDICGGTINADSGELTSPGYPQMRVLPYGTVCEWHVIGSPEHVFVIKPVDMHLPQLQPDCNTKVDIEETLPQPHDKSINLLKTFCGNETVYTAIETSSNRFTVKLTYGTQAEWDHISETRGFRISFKISRQACGEIITASEGYFSTPNYPQETTSKLCWWFIAVPKNNRRIRLELIDSDLHKHTVSVFNDILYRTAIPNISNDTSGINNPIYESVGNDLMLEVNLSRLSTSHRLKAKFTSDEEALCGGDLTGASQDLVSPDLERAYTCGWHYNGQVDTDKQNDFVYNSISLTANFNCSVNGRSCSDLEFKIILMGPTNYGGIRFYTHIYKSSPVSYTIPSSTLDIRAIKTTQLSVYFHLNWKLQPCGGTVHISSDPVNIITTPNNYNDSIDCAWLLVSPEDEQAEFQMEGSFVLDCENEYVILYHNLDQKAIGKYCREQLMETPLVTYYLYMYVQYHSNVNNNTSIKLTAKSVTHQCGGLLTSYQKTFTSPNYPKSYTANQECVWEIHAELGYRVSLQFIERFVIEDRPNCTKDVVIIYDWKDNAYVEMARVCGRHPPPVYNSTHDRLKVVLRTDAETNLDGFKARWTPICGGEYIATDKEQMLYSPGYPNGYKSDMYCIYKLRAPNRNKVLIKFLEFDLEVQSNEEYSHECNSDSLLVIAYDYYRRLEKVFCGRQIPAPIRTYEELHMLFDTERHGRKKGFKLSYSINKCGGRVNDTTEITSSFGDNNYDNYMYCMWVIEAPPTKIVVVKFFYIDLESHPRCRHDYIALYDGLNIDEDKRYAKLCGYVNTTTVLTSKGNSTVLEFKTDATNTYKGFKAVISFSYSEAVGCGGRIDLTANSSHILKSPLISNVVYENFLACRWSITSPPGTVINIKFTKFHIAPCRNVNQTAEYSKCDCDSVEIKEGLNPKSLVIGTYCDDVLPPQLITSANAMSVSLSTDGELVSSGFEATLTVKQSLCGESSIPVTYTPRRIKTPGYETGSVPPGVHCSYSLYNSANMYTELRISIVHLQLHPPVIDSTGVRHCFKDRLIVSSAASRSTGSDVNHIIMNHRTSEFFDVFHFYESSSHITNSFDLCGNMDAVNFYLHGNTIINLITFPDMDNELHKRVEIEVQVVGFCGRNYTEPQGRLLSIHSRDEPINKTSGDCYTLITAPENYTINVYFLDVLNFYNTHRMTVFNNEASYIEMFDGNTTDAKNLMKSYYDVDIHPVFSTGRYMLLHNHKIADGERMTYDMNYVTTNKGVGCGGKLNNIVGAVTSPLYPNTYRHNSICEWVLETPVDTNLMIKFTEFDLGVNCEHNYIHFVDSKGVVVRTFCFETPADYTSDDNYLKLVFYTSMNNSGRGWSAIFAGIKA